MIEYGMNFCIVRHGGKDLLIIGWCQYGDEKPLLASSDVYVSIEDFDLPRTQPTPEDYERAINRITRELFYYAGRHLQKHNVRTDDDNTSGTS